MIPTPEQLIATHGLTWRISPAAVGLTVFVALNINNTDYVGGSSQGGWAPRLVPIPSLELSYRQKLSNGDIPMAYRSKSVRLTRESGRPVAQELGISEKALYRWRSKPRQVESQGRTRQAMWDEQGELTWLTRGNATLRKEQDFPQHAAACFAREPP